jgi:hypothetical protein
VKLDEIEGTRTPLDTSKGFEKKSNKGTYIFIGAVVLLALVLIALLIYVVSKQGNL